MEGFSAATLLVTVLPESFTTPARRFCVLLITIRSNVDNIYSYVYIWMGRI